MKRLKAWMLRILLEEVAEMAIQTNNHRLADCVLVILDELEAQQ